MKKGEYHLGERSANKRSRELGPRVSEPWLSGELAFLSHELSFLWLAMVLASYGCLSKVP